MLDNLHNLDLTTQDIELIESALQTQKKILAVQSEAGGSGAHKKLTELKHLIKRINRKAAPQPQGWYNFARMFVCTDCSQPR